MEQWYCYLLILSPNSYLIFSLGFGIKVYELLLTIQYGFKKVVKLCLVLSVHLFRLRFKFYRTVSKKYLVEKIT